VPGPSDRGARRLSWWSAGPPRPVLGDHYPDFETQEQSLQFGMWIFLASEVLLFAALFTLYAAYRAMFPADFREAIAHNTLAFGTINTYVLLGSSFTAALSVSQVRRARPRAAALLLATTAFLGLVFLGIKALEYWEHWREGALPGPYYHFHELPSFGANRFYTIYWAVTGVHALHVTGGIGVVTWMAVRAWRRYYTPEHHTRLEMGTLYWHLVDVIWIFLWPLLYLS
jgi:cytochrome c oxidase subunit 3